MHFDIIGVNKNGCPWDFLVTLLYRCKEYYLVHDTHFNLVFKICLRLRFLHIFKDVKSNKCTDWIRSSRLSLKFSLYFISLFVYLILKTQLIVWYTAISFMPSVRFTSWDVNTCKHLLLCFYFSFTSNIRVIEVKCNRINNKIKKLLVRFCYKYKSKLVGYVYH